MAKYLILAARTEYAMLTVVEKPNEEKPNRVVVEFTDAPEVGHHALKLDKLLPVAPAGKKRVPSVKIPKAVQA